MSFEHDEQMRAIDEAIAKERDQRRGVPSASGMERLMNCPPSFDMERLAPAEEESEDAASGTRIHAVLALQASTGTLNGDELDTVQMCMDQCQQVTQEWNGTAGASHPQAILPDQTIYERRLGINAFGKVYDVTPDSKADFIFTGQADLILVKDKRAIVIDYKTGRGETAIAQENPQLAALAVLVAGRFCVESVRVAIVQPWAGKPTVSDYNAHALALARSWLLSALGDAAASMPSDARAGEWCKYCRAKASCDAYKQAAFVQVEALNVSSIVGADAETQRKALFARAMELRAETLAASVRGLGIVKRFVQAIEAAAKQRAGDDVEFQKFFRIKEKKGRRSVSNVQLVASRAFAAGVAIEDFTRECSITLGSVKELLRKATGAKGKELEAVTDSALLDACEITQPSKELEAVEGAIYELH